MPFLLPTLMSLCSLVLTADKPDVVAQFEVSIEKARSDWQVPGLAVGVVFEGKVVLARGYGVRSLGGNPVDAMTLFSIGSTTKAMTAASLAILADEGRLRWDDPVVDHLEDFRMPDPYVTSQVTVRDLLTHRAGLGNADLLWYGTDRSRSDILARVPWISEAYSLRSGFIYQNIMYIAAGEVAAAIEGRSWEDTMRHRLFEPLGMDRTVPTTTDAMGRDNVARPHHWKEDEVVRIENEILDEVAAAGAVWSSVEDMAQWMLMLLNGGRLGERSILSDTAVQEILRPQTVLDMRTVYPYIGRLEPQWGAYGLGFFLLDYHGEKVCFHTGSIDGMSAIVGIVPRRSLGIVVLANLDHAELRHALLWEGIDRWSGRSPKDWSGELLEFYTQRKNAVRDARATLEKDRREGTTPSLKKEAYVGVYTNELYGDVKVFLREGALRYFSGVRRQGTLSHWHYDTFRTTPDRHWQGPGFATFSLDRRGMVSSLEIYGSRFQKRDPE